MVSQKINVIQILATLNEAVGILRSLYNNSTYYIGSKTSLLRCYNSNSRLDLLTDKLASYPDFINIK
jgi:hypothetical protein